MISPSYHKCWINQAFKVVTFSIFTAKLKAPPNGLLRHTGGCRENAQCRQRICCPTNAPSPPGMGRFQLLNLGFLDYGLELRFWVVIAIIVSLTITIITTLTII